MNVAFILSLIVMLFVLVLAYIFKSWLGLLSVMVMMLVSAYVFSGLFACLYVFTALAATMVLSASSPR